MNEVLKQMGKILINVAVIVLIIAAIALKVMGLKILYVSTDSMEPTFRTNQLVLAEKVTGDDVEVGDICTYKSIGTLYTVTHRVIGTDGDKLVFKGDNNEDPDPKPISRDRVIYRAVLY